MKKMLKILCMLMLVGGLVLTGCGEGSSDANVIPPPSQPEITEPSEPNPPVVEKIDFSSAIEQVKKYLLRSVVLDEDFTEDTQDTFATITFSRELLYEPDYPEEAQLLWEEDETNIAEGFLAKSSYDDTTVTITITKIKTE